MTDDHLEQTLFRWPGVLRACMAGDDDWLKGFAKSIARHAKRPAWRPTPKQAALMTRLVRETAMYVDDEVVTDVE